jgi:hypothetical protein
MSYNADYLPASDQSLLIWVVNLLNQLAAAGLARWGFPEDVYQALVLLRDDYAQKLETANEPATRTKAAVQAKNDSRKALKAAIRQAVKEYLTNNHTVTNQDRDNLGLPVYDKKPTQAPLPTDMPVGEVNTSKHQQHTLHVKAGSLTGKTRPPKVRGFEVWHKLGGDPPASDAEWVYMNFSSRSSLLINYPQTEVGKTVYYRFRWMNTRNQPGPWSESYVSAVIA